MTPEVDLKELIDHSDDICVSIYMPTHPTHLELQQADPIRLRNLIDRARVQISRFTPFMRHPDIERLLQPAVQLLRRNGDFWKHQAGALAICLGMEFSRVYRLPLVVEPLVTVGSRFYIRPLLPLVTRHDAFYILAFSQNEVRLFHATQDSIEGIELRDVPTSMEQALAHDDPEKQLQFHGAAGAPGAAGKRAAIFYSHGTFSTHKKDMLLRYCQQVESGLQRYLHQQTEPLVLACVGYLFAIYQQVNSYPFLFPEFVPGSPDRLGESDLHEKAWAVVQPSFQQRRQDRLAQCCRLLGQGRASVDIGQIVRAAFQGRVATLFVAPAAQQWGCFNQHTGEVYLHEYATQQSQELLNLATIYTLKNDGVVYRLQPRDLPASITMAAVFRY